MNKYRFNRPLTENDLMFINNLPHGSVIEFRNTVNQDPEIFKRIKPTITVRIIGGLDEVEKPKYNDQKYYERTLYSPLEVAKIIEKMELIESRVKKEWTDLEKAMYIYKELCLNMRYDYSYENWEGRDYNRSLISLLRGKAVCAGFAMIYKEMMERQGIPCIYQNKQHGHAWNLVKINGRYIPVDLTWDITANEGKNRCDFIFFGRDKQFFDNPNHMATNETIFPPEVLSDQEFYTALNNISYQENKEEESKYFVRNNGKKVYFTVLEEGPFKRCIIEEGDRLITVLFDDTIELRAILNYDYPRGNNRFVSSYNTNNLEELFRLNSNVTIYEREDKSRFFLQKTNGRNGNTLIHKYIDFESKDGKMVTNTRKLYSEDDLVKVPEGLRVGVANILLSKERVLEKSRRFKGYVGYLGIERGRYKKYVNPDNEQRIAGVKRF